MTEVGRRLEFASLVLLMILSSSVVVVWFVSGGSVLGLLRLPQWRMLLGVWLVRDVAFLLTDRRASSAKQRIVSLAVTICLVSICWLS
jgi:hypothetical protein